jgi:hypothetical protein
VIAPPGMRWRVVVAEGASDTRSQVIVGCAQIREAGQARSFIVKNIAAGLDYGDVLTSNVAERVEPGSWPIDGRASLTAEPTRGSSPRLELVRAHPATGSRLWTAVR